MTTTTTTDLGPNGERWRMGGYGGKQRMIPDPKTGELRPYMRVSAFAQAMSEIGILPEWKAHHVLRGAEIAPDLAAQARASKKVPYDLINQLHALGGGNAKRDRGKDRHTLLAMALTGAPMPDMPPAARAELDRILRLIEELGEIVAVEAPVVCDDWQLSGTADLILTSRADTSHAGGMPIVADFKTGGDYRLSAAIQLVAYARSRFWDFDTETRGGLVAPTLPRLVMIHAPQDGAEPRAITLDPHRARAAADLAMQVRRVRKEWQS